MTRERAHRFQLEAEESFEESCRWLQSKLGHSSTSLPDEPVKPPRPPEQWLRIHDHSHFGVDMFASGEDSIDIFELTIAVLLRSGECWVGAVECQRPNSIILRLWGGTGLRVGLNSIHRVSLLSTHTAAEVRVVCCRQRCGEPAATFPPSPRPNELSDPPTP